LSEVGFRSEDALTRIQKEVTVLASLHHPNIVKYHVAWLEAVELAPANVTILEEENFHPELPQIERARSFYF